MPDWFPTVLADAQRALLDAEARHAQQSAQRAHVTAAVAAADAACAVVHAATAADRDALQHAEARAIEARRRYTAAQHQLTTAPRRLRRSLRHDAHVAEQQLERAQNYLERTRQRTGPAVERDARAVADQRDAHDRLRNCEAIELLDAMLPSVGEERRNVRALTTWQHWAQGHDLSDRALHRAFAVLKHRPGAEPPLAASLRDQLATPVDPDPRPAHHLEDPEVRVAGHDFGLEL
jgi:hypothetical protein